MPAGLHLSPVLHRELARRSRQRATFVVRTAVAALAGLTTLLLAAYTTALRPGVPPGLEIFSNILFFVLVLVALEAIRQTADSFSSERRGCTLPLLYLTPLRPFEIVIGKLAAAALPTYFTVLAIAPVMAIPFLVGGLTPFTFFCGLVALLHTLWIALAIGIWASTTTADDTRAFLRALALLGALSFLPLLVDQVPVFSELPTLSPIALAIDSLSAAARLVPFRLGGSIALQQLVAVLLLVDASRRARLAESPPPVAPPAGNDAARDLPSTPFRLSKRRPRPLTDATAPCAWLFARTGHTPALLWIGGLLPLSAEAISWTTTRLFGAGRSDNVLYFLVSACGMASPLLLALASTRGFSRCRQEGVLELLLTSPIDTGTIISGQWQTLWKSLHPILWIEFLGSLLIGLVPVLFLGGAEPLRAYVMFRFLEIVAGVLALPAVCWLGMWFGLSTQTPARAVGWTLAAFMVPPWIIASATGLFLVLGLQAVTDPSQGAWLLLPSILSTFVISCYYVAAIVWARRNLLRRFRDAAAR